MPASFTRAAKSQSRLRLALIGPAGSGKTYSALAIATALGSRVAVIDTERGSASKYAHKFTFDVFEPATFAPEVYIDAIRAAESAGYDVLIIDSLSHAWSGKGGILEFVDNETRRSNSHNAYTDGWRKATPKHNELVEAMLLARVHLIATMRSKTEYILEKDDKGRSVPRKVGLQPIQRDGLEYEFDVVGDMSIDHDYMISKTRCEELSGAILSKPGADLAKTLKAWLTDGVPLPKVSVTYAQLSTPAEPVPAVPQTANSPAPLTGSEPQVAGFASASPAEDPISANSVPQRKDSEPQATYFHFGDSSIVPEPKPEPESKPASESIPAARSVAWSPAQLQAVIDAHLSTSPAQIAAALNLSRLPEDADPATCLAWSMEYASARTAGAAPISAAVHANNRVLGPISP